MLRKSSKKRLLFLVFFLLLLAAKEHILPTRADETQHEGIYYFNISPDTYLIPSSGVLYLKVTHGTQKLDDLSRVRFRPKMETTPIMIYNTQKNGWISGESSWSDLPSIDETIKVKVPLSTPNPKISGVIKDLETGQEYETPELLLWKELDYKNYEARLNSTIREWRETRQFTAASPDIKKGDPPEEVGETPEEASTLPLEALQGGPNSALVGMTGFFTSAIIGFTKKSDKMLL